MIKHCLNRYERYLCNGACSITEDKCVASLKDVTCKNCNKIIKRIKKESWRSK